MEHSFIRQLRMNLLKIKEIDIRMLTLKQAYESADSSIHIGGCCSATIPMVSLFYGGFIKLNAAKPFHQNQDKFIISKGHSIALIASIYADLGLLSGEDLVLSRSDKSIVKGHPGPLIPGVDISTGPLGQGLSSAIGFALYQKLHAQKNVYCLLGDGELQEGMIWEAVQYAAYSRINNLCAVIDMNNGQVDSIEKRIVDVDYPAMFEAAGWRCICVDGQNYHCVTNAFETFVSDPACEKPTAIFCNTKKGYGACSSALNAHKAKINKKLYESEVEQLTFKREESEKRVLNDLNSFTESDQKATVEMMKSMRFEPECHEGAFSAIKPLPLTSKVQRPLPIEKSLKYDENEMPSVVRGETIACSKVISQIMTALGHDPHVVTIDCDLGGISGLYAGMAGIDQNRAFNVGVAESNMMAIGEAFATSGMHCWVSGFCSFFDLRVLRRIAIGYQEREEVIRNNGWLNKGYTPDLVFLGTASNLDTGANGATHMANDDLMLIDEIPHVKIIDISCPRQMIGVAKWIAAGGKGLVYIRVMRAPSSVLYDESFHFEYGQLYRPFPVGKPQIIIVSSGHGVHEALEAQRILLVQGIAADVVDAPSFQRDAFKELFSLHLPVLVAEQNNGYLRKKIFMEKMDNQTTYFINTLDSHQNPQFIHSGSYRELVERLGLDGNHIAEKVKAILT